MMWENMKLKLPRKTLGTPLQLSIEVYNCGLRCYTLQMLLGKAR